MEFHSERSWHPNNLWCLDPFKQIHILCGWFWNINDLANTSIVKLIVKCHSKILAFNNWRWWYIYLFLLEIWFLLQYVMDLMIYLLNMTQLLPLFLFRDNLWTRNLPFPSISAHATLQNSTIHPSNRLKRTRKSIYACLWGAYWPNWKDKNKT